MQSVGAFTLILKYKKIKIPSDFPQLTDVNQEIYDELITKKQYKVKSQVDEYVFKSFIKHWTNGDIPIISSENIYDFEELSQEFDRMKDIISLYMKHLINSSNISSLWRNEILQRKKFKKSDILEVKMIEYQQIIYFLFNNNSINSYSDFSKIKKKLFKSILNSDVKLVELLTRPKINHENGFYFALNEISKTATLYKSFSWSLNTQIPSTVKYKSEDYVVTDMADNSFKNSEIGTIFFDKNSELRIFNKDAFKESYNTIISIPSCAEIKGDYNCPYFRHIYVVPTKEKNIKNYKDDFILGKTNLKSNVFDVFIFALRNVTKIVIPSYIKVIAENAFRECKNLNFVDFVEDSELEIIEENAFENTPIAEIKIPPHVKKIGNFSFRKSNVKTVIIPSNSELRYLDLSSFSESFITNLTIPSHVFVFKRSNCYELTRLNNIIITQNKEQNIMYYHNEFVLGKTNPKNDTFDILLFARSDIKKAVIPSFIKVISTRAFADCHELKTIEFEGDSELQLIKDAAFCYCSIEKIILPPHVGEIGKMLFQDCEYLKKIEFSENSELRSIEKYFSNCASIENIKIPSHVRKISAYAFSECSNMQTIELSDNTELETIEECAFYECPVENLCIPSNIVDFKEGWCDSASHIKNIKIINSKKEYILKSENQFLLSKGNILNENFDILIYAFQNVQSIVVPATVKRISPYAFVGCECLKKVDFSPYCELNVIDKYAFSNSSIEEITIPDQFTEICEGGFLWCQSLNNVYITKNSKLRKIGKEAFSHTLINSIEIPQHVTEINERAFLNCEKLNIVKFSDKSELKIIGELSFSSTDVEEINIPSCVTVIEKEAFCKCNKLQRVTFSDECELLIIGEGSFSSTSIKSISIPKSVTKLVNLHLVILILKISLLMINLIYA